MKLSKYAIISATTASAVVYSFGVMVSQVGAEGSDLDNQVLLEVAAEAGAALDSDEALVDELSSVESQLENSGVDVTHKGIGIGQEVSDEVQELIDRRKAIIAELRSGLAGLEGEERQEYLKKIRDRRKEVRTEIHQQWRAKKTELRAKLAERREELKAKKAEAKERLQDARESFKEGLQDKKDAAMERKKDAAEKFQDRVETTKKKHLLEAGSDGDRSDVIRKKNLEQQQVLGAMDVDTSSLNLLERIGFWLGDL